MAWWLHVIRGGRLDLDMLNALREVNSCEDNMFRSNIDDKVERRFAELLRERYNYDGTRRRARG